MSTSSPYRVLARKYRPQNFSELIGQDALVRTLQNAIQTGRIAHAFMLTGVRGIGKTTTARIIAKSLNYTGTDGKAGPTIGSTDDCKICQAISEDRHPDVIEMDAATRTGVDDIREILEGVRYAPSEARYKIYIIDEVHMLSKQAFNALLKTLEEPPPHVKFIFATTEIRKVPITVLSRCQRFDLRRVDEPTLSTHFSKICDLEKVEIEADALTMIARAADGSVRDGLSLLDQAMALGGEKITNEQVQEMLGLADKQRTLDLLGYALEGKTKEALYCADDLYKNGAEPISVIQDCLDLTHYMTRLKAVPEHGVIKSLSQDQTERMHNMVKELTMSTLGKAWQILLKGISEVQMAPSPQGAVEMLIIRLIYAANLPDPDKLLKTLLDNPQIQQPVPTTNNSGLPQGAPPAGRVRSGNGGTHAAPMPQAQQNIQTSEEIKSLEDVVSLLEDHRSLVLAGQVYQFVHLVKLKKGHIEITLDEFAPQTVPQDLHKTLKQITGEHWMISVANSGIGAPTLAQKAEATKQAEFNRALATPIMQDIVKLFPEAQLIEITKNDQKKD